MHNYVCSDCGGPLDIGGPVHLPPGLPPAREAHCPRCDQGKSFDGADRLVQDMDAVAALKARHEEELAQRRRREAEEKAAAEAKREAESRLRLQQLRDAATRTLNGARTVHSEQILRSYADTIGVDVRLPLADLAKRVLAATA